MGRDKAMLVWEGKTLLERAVELGRKVCAEVVILSSNPDHEVRGNRRISDNYPGLGPMGAIATAMEELPDRELFLVIGVDQPLLPYYLLKILLDRFREKGTDLALAFREGYDHQPLGAVYHRDALFGFQKFLETKERLSLQMLFEHHHRFNGILFRRYHYLAFDPFANLNSPEDLAVMDIDAINKPKVEVLFFGYLRDRARRTEMIVSAADTDELRSRLEEKFTALQGLNYMVAVNQTVEPGKVALKNGDEVALMPPFAGG